MVVGVEVVHQRRGKRAAASLDVGRRFLYHGGARIGIRVSRSGQAHAKAEEPTSRLQETRREDEEETGPRRPA